MLNFAIYEDRRRSPYLEFDKSALYRSINPLEYNIEIVNTK